MTNLFQMDKEISLLVQSAIDPTTGEVSDENILQAIEALAISRDEKAKGVISWSKKLDYDVVSIDSEISRLKALKEKIENRSEKLRNYLKENMEANQMTEWNLGTMILKIKKNPPKLVLSIEANRFLEETYCGETMRKAEETIRMCKEDLSDKKKEIKKLLTEGSSVTQIIGFPNHLNGCSLEQGTRLDVQ